ncbi:SRPBCC family protein [Pedobacter frigoris]|uniref:Polyketide cyclase n=1 Tax=Pedobacter frigoris TaxID=2571272 RepID=A0A4U1CI36_9SPHI|nr:SRPBCC family protein [Pedobacter frigoris]TKC07043.1 polyketide cyclase [Pedobacter frigoris]
MEPTVITVENTINAPVARVWEAWTNPEHITKWSFASDDWHTPYAYNDIRTGGKFKSTMAAKDGSMSFDFEGIYSNVEEHKLIEYAMADGRKVKISFTDQGDSTKVVESFDAENTNPIEMQQGGWQAILDNFKKYTETLL